MSPGGQGRASRCAPGRTPSSSPWVPPCPWDSEALQRTAGALRRPVVRVEAETQHGAARRPRLTVGDRTAFQTRSQFRNGLGRTFLGSASSHSGLGGRDRRIALSARTHTRAHTRAHTHAHPCTRPVRENCARSHGCTLRTTAFPDAADVVEARGAVSGVRTQEATLGTTAFPCPLRLDRRRAGDCPVLAVCSRWGRGPPQAAERVPAPVAGSEGLSGPPPSRVSTPHAAGVARAADLPGSRERAGIAHVTSEAPARASEITRAGETSAGRFCPCPWRTRESGGKSLGRSPCLSLHGDGF